MIRCVRLPENHSNDWTVGKSPFQVVVLWVTLSQTQAPAVVVDHDAGDLRCPEDFSTTVEDFRGARSHRVIEGAGHNLPEVAPREFADAVRELASSKS